MNEKIKELALQAGGSFYPDVNSKQLERFAELILEECMTICERAAERNDSAINCYYEIKRKFRS